MEITCYILTKFNRNTVAIILAFLLLLIFAGDRTAAHELGNPGGEPTRFEPSQPSIALAAGTTFVVNSNDNDSDSNPGDGQCDTGSNVTINGNTSPECTLRAAIEESNNLNGHETINFNIRNSDGSCPGVVTIDTPTSLFLDDTDLDNAGVTIDGYSQCGAKPNTKEPPAVGNAVIRIQIRGARSNSHNGLTIQSSGNTIKGLAIYRSRRNIYIEKRPPQQEGDPLGPTPTNNTIQGNFIGSNADLSWGSYGDGISIKHSLYTLIGGYRPEERNIFVGTRAQGLTTTGDNVRFIVIIGNYFGVKQDGKTKGPAGKTDGMDLDHGLRYSWIGASPPGWIDYTKASSAKDWPPTGVAWAPEDDPNWQDGDPVPPPDRNRVYDDRERNIISGNVKDGMEISHTPGPSYNYVLNNYIGVDVSGTKAVGNGRYGITVEDLPHHNFIYDNVIANNGYSGIHLWGLANYNEIVDNYIGVAADGVTPMGNGVTQDTNIYAKEGVSLWAGSRHNLIKHNIIANNVDEGIWISSKEDSGEPPRHSHKTFYNTITQNSIYNNDGKGIRLHSGSTTSLIGNQGLPAPQIASVNLSTSTINGTACADCLIEFFIAQVNDSDDLNHGGEGKTFIGQVTANGAGNFSWSPISGVNEGDMVTATATDALGNTSEFGPNVEATLGEKPLGTVLLNGGTGLQSAYSDVLAQFSAIDNNQVKYWRYRVDNPDLSGISWTSIPSPGPTFEDEVVLTSLSDGLHTIYAQYKDNEENVSTVYNATITVVNVGNPDDPDNGQIIINNGDPYTNNPNLSLQLIAPIPTSSDPAFYTKDMKVGKDSLSGSDWEPYDVQTAWALDNPPTNSKTVWMYARFRDANNNPTPSQVFDTILFDPVTPTLTVSLDTDTKVLDLSGSQDDAGGSGLGEMRIYDAGNHDSGWIAYKTTYTWPGPDGTIINVQLRDNAGNETEVTQVVLPSEAPVGTVSLNGGTGLQSADSDVVAEFWAEDNSAVAAWRYSVDTDINGVAWTNISHVSPFSTSEILSLSNGFHTVYAQYKDDDGNVSLVYSATITVGAPPAGGYIYLPIIFR